MVLFIDAVKTVFHKNGFHRDFEVRREIIRSMVLFKDSTDFFSIDATCVSEQ